MDTGQEERAALRREVEQLRLLASVTDRINAGLTLGEVLDHIYASFAALLPYDRIGCALLSDDGGTVRTAWGRSRAAVMHVLPGYAAPLLGSSLQPLLVSGAPRILNDLAAYLEAKPSSVSTRLVVAEGLRSSLTCPLLVEGKPIGFLFFSSMQPGTYRDSHVELYQRLASRVALALDKSRQHDRLVELNELKNRFLGMAAHDLRNPLSVVGGFANLLLRGAAGPVTPDQQEALQHIAKAGERMLGLVDEFLDVSVIESGKLELRLVEVSPADVLREAETLQRDQAEAKGIALIFDTAAAPPRVRLDPARFSQVLNNLISNAIKYSASGTSVTVTVAAEPGAVLFAVTDQGQGIPAAELSKLFTAFGRTSVRPTGGEKSTGLGLMISKKIVEAHGGTIGVESAVGKGSTFTVTLPAI